MLNNQRVNWIVLGISRQRKIFIGPKYRTASESQSLDLPGRSNGKFWVYASPLVKYAL